MDLPGAMYGQAVYWTEHEISFGQDKPSMFLQNFYNECLVMGCKFCERASVILKSALLKFTFNHDIFLAATHYVPTVTFMIESTRKAVYVKLK